MTRILFVEDEPRGVSGYFTSLERNDFICDLAQDFDDAVAKLQSAKYDVLSLDIMFSPGKKSMGKIEPRQAGLRLVELIRQGHIPNCDPGLKIIVLTAVPSSNIEEKIKSFGVLAYLKKPIAYEEVIDTFKRLC